MKLAVTLLSIFAAMMTSSYALAHEPGASVFMHSLMHAEVSAAIWMSGVVAVISGSILGIRKRR